MKKKIVAILVALLSVFGMLSPVLAEEKTWLGVYGSPSLQSYSIESSTNNTASAQITNAIESSNLIWTKYDGSGNGTAQNALIYGTDYTWENKIFYKNNSGSTGPEVVDENTVNTVPGSYYVVLNGIGSYNGTAYLNFYVSTANDINDGEKYMVNWGSSSYVYKLSQSRNILEDIKSGNVYIYHKETNGGTTKLQYNVDFKESGRYYCYVNNGSYTEKKEVSEQDTKTKAGDYYIEIIGIGNYAGATEINFEVAEANSIANFTVAYKNQSRYAISDTRTLLTDLEDGTIYLSETNSDGTNTKLTYNTDYTIGKFYKYLDYTEVAQEYAYTNAGEYVAELNGSGNYTGTNSVHFTMTKANDISNYDVFAGTYYIGEADQFESDLKNNILEWSKISDGSNVSLVYDTDYVLDSYNKYDSDSGEHVTIAKDEAFATVGEINAVLKGKGNYEGTVEVYINVCDPNNFDSLYVWMDNGVFYSTQSDSFTDRLEWTDVKENQKDLKENVDYTVTYYRYNETGAKEAITDSDPVGYIRSHAGNYNMVFSPITYTQGEDTKEIDFKMIVVPAGVKTKSIKTVTLSGETFSIKAGNSAKSTAKVLINGNEISSEDAENITNTSYWTEANVKADGTFTLVDSSKAAETFETGKYYVYVGQVKIKNTNTVMYLDEVKSSSDIAVDAYTGDNAWGYSYQDPDDENTWIYEVLIDEPIKCTEEASSSSSAKADTTSNASKSANTADSSDLIAYTLGLSSSIAVAIAVYVLKRKYAR